MMPMQVMNPNDEVLHTQQALAKSSFGFTAKMSGDYKACFTARGVATAMCMSDTNACSMWLRPAWEQGCSGFCMRDALQLIRPACWWPGAGVCLGARAPA